MPSQREVVRALAKHLAKHLLHHQLAGLVLHMACAHTMCGM